MNKTSFLPSYYDESKVGTIYQSRDEQVIREAEEFKEKNNIKPSTTDRFKIALFMIDVQNSFTDPQGSLFVPGAVEDNINITKFIYRNINKITSCIASMDSHLPYQIFTPLWWIDNTTKKHPEPFTLISTDDIKKGKYSAIFQPQDSLAYCEELEKQGKKILTIWPIHTMIGSISHSLNSSVYEAILFHSTVRTSQPTFLQKGTVPNTENYSVLSPEVRKTNHPQGGFNTPFFNALMKHDRVYICGEASSHCVMETLVDMQKEFGGDKDMLDKVYILEDCMSPVSAVTDNNGKVIVDFPKIAKDALDSFRNAGMHLIKSTEDIIY
jgi:nicotinamidase-related amidase